MSVDFAPVCPKCGNELIFLVVESGRLVFVRGPNVGRCNLCLNDYELPEEPTDYDEGD